MNITLITIGHKPPRWVSEGFEDYIRRLPREYHLHVIEIPFSERHKKNESVEDRRLREGKSLLKAVPASDRLIALDEKGVLLRTDELAKQWSRWRMEGRNISFIVGGPDGLSKDCLTRAEWTWSLSPLTFPHFLVRLIIAEQMYRAWTILSGHPYHRG